VALLVTLVAQFRLSLTGTVPGDMTLSATCKTHSKLPRWDFNNNIFTVVTRGGTGLGAVCRLMADYFPFMHNRVCSKQQHDIDASPGISTKMVYIEGKAKASSALVPGMKVRKKGGKEEVMEGAERFLYIDRNDMQPPSCYGMEAV
jgi:hypothetical protein